MLRHTVCLVPSRRLDDRIRDLCSRITIASPEHTHRLLKELRLAIREKIEMIRKLAASGLVGGSGPRVNERRSRTENRNGEHTNGSHASS
jgi:hypothetical protein